jgi:hypothetical protein
MKYLEKYITWQWLIAILFLIALFITAEFATSSQLYEPLNKNKTMGWSLKFNLSTAHVKETYLAKKVADDAEGLPILEKVGTVYHQSDGPFYFVVITTGVVDTVKLKAKWIAVNAAGSINQIIGEADNTIDHSTLFYFDFSLPRIWPVGKYKVELYFNDKLDRSVDFEVAIDK